MENKERELLVEFLNQSNCGRRISIGDSYYFLQLLTGILKNEKRWLKYARKREGEAARETVYDHLIHKFFWGGQMVAMQKSYGDEFGLELRPAVLFLSFFTYSMTVALHGDVALMDRNFGHLHNEEEDFRAMLSIFPDETRHYLRAAFDVSRERGKALVSGRPLSEVSTNGQFLWAVVVMSSFAKALYEVENGYGAFANTFHNLREDAEYLSRRFYSFRELLKREWPRIEKIMKDYPLWKE